jgi:hypothetical protein
MVYCFSVKDALTEAIKSATENTFLHAHSVNVDLQTLKLCPSPEHDPLLSPAYRPLTTFGPSLAMASLVDMQLMRDGHSSPSPSSIARALAPSEEGGRSDLLGVPPAC